MATLISVYDNGVLVGRCDAHCHDAAGIGSAECDCICRGANHGVGLSQAIANTAAMAPAWMKRERKQRRSRKLQFEMPLITQQRLF